jgi:hypothetical protein
VSNVSLLHEAPLEVLREEPRAVLDLLRVAGQPESARGSLVAEVLDSELTEAVPSVRRADLVVLFRRPNGRGACVVVVVVEVQRERDRKKLAAWPLYIAYLHARYGVPVTLLVLAQEDAVASWARTPRQVGPNLMLAPWALGPSDLPEVTSVEQALVNPELGVLTALARLGSAHTSKLRREALDAEVARVFEALLRANKRRERHVYLALLHRLAGTSLRGTLRKLLEDHGMGRAMEIIYAEVRAESKAEGKAMGRAEGRAIGEAEALLRILHKRGLHLDAASEQRIRGMRDLATLDRWLDRALDVTSVEELLA